MSTLINNVYKPRYTVAYLSNNKVWSYKNSRLRRIVALRGRRFFRGGLFRRYVLVATTRKWTEARRRFRPFRLRLGRGRAGGVGLSVLGRPRRRRYRDVFYTKQQLRSFHGKRSERWLQNTLKRSSFHASSVQSARSRSFIASLESRLDRVLFRARLLPTIFACHQYIHHLGLSVNGALEFSPQAILRPGDVVSLVPFAPLSTKTNPRRVTSRSARTESASTELSPLVYADTQEIVAPPVRFKWADTAAKRLSRWRTIYWDLFCRVYYRRWGLFTLRRRNLSHLKKKLRPFASRRPLLGVPSFLFSQPSKPFASRTTSLSSVGSSILARSSRGLAIDSSPSSVQKFRQYVKVWLSLRLRSAFLPRASESEEASTSYRRSRPSRRRTRHRFLVARRRKKERATKTPRLRPVHLYVPPYLHVDFRTLRTVRICSPTSETVVYPFRASPAQIETFYRSRGFLFLTSGIFTTIVRSPVCFCKRFYVLLLQARLNIF